jgi:hypothetical protein
MGPGYLYVLRIPFFLPGMGSWDEASCLSFPVTRSPDDTWRDYHDLLSIGSWDFDVEGLAVLKPECWTR